MSEGNAQVIDDKLSAIWNVIRTGYATVGLQYQRVNIRAEKAENGGWVLCHR